jgi:hypothetical protein
MNERIRHGIPSPLPHPNTIEGRQEIIDEHRRIIDENQRREALKLLRTIAAQGAKA